MWKRSRCGSRREHGARRTGAHARQHHGAGEVRGVHADPHDRDGARRCRIRRRHDLCKVVRRNDLQRRGGWLARHDRVADHGDDQYPGRRRIRDRELVHAPGPRARRLHRSPARLGRRYNHVRQEIRRRYRDRCLRSRSRGITVAVLARDHEHCAGRGRDGITGRGPGRRIMCSIARGRKRIGLSASW